MLAFSEFDRVPATDQLAKDSKTALSSILILMLRSSINVLGQTDV